MPSAIARGVPSITIRHGLRRVSQPQISERDVAPLRSWTLADSYGFMARYAQNQQRDYFGTRGISTPHCSPNGKHQATLRAAPTFTSKSTRHGLCTPPSYPRCPTRPKVSMLREQTRSFHDYFVTHLPSSSLHPDSQSPREPHHKLPRSESKPHKAQSGRYRAATPMVGMSRETTVVRIPLKSAKHHFGVSISRGTRAYNEDAYQAGVIEIPAFAKRTPVSLTRSPKSQSPGQGTLAENAGEDPQTFYFGVFDGHGGAECSGFLRESLHRYVEDTASLFDLRSSLKREDQISADASRSSQAVDEDEEPESDSQTEVDGESMEQFKSLQARAVDLEWSLVRKWNETVGGYFRRFRPPYFDLGTRTDGHKSADKTPSTDIHDGDDAVVSVEAVMAYAFLRADLDFILAQADKEDEDAVQADRALNENDVLGETHRVLGQPGEQQKRFKGGSTCSVAMISTPTPTPFWHPTTSSTLVTSHVGDTRILLCSTATGAARSLTTNHHPSSPSEGQRLRRYAATFVTDSFGEERMSGLANTRAFGDIQSKRIGVSAEPEIQRVDLKPAEYSFLVLVSDGISGTLNDQEIVDVVKEARTPEQGARDVVSLATEVSTEGDNATCMVVRLGGWERRIEGGLGAMGTREVRDWRRKEAAVPRSRRT